MLSYADLALAYHVRRSSRLLVVLLGDWLRSQVRQLRHVRRANGLRHFEGFQGHVAKTRHVDGIERSVALVRVQLPDRTQVFPEVRSVRRTEVVLNAAALSGQVPILATSAWVGHELAPLAVLELRALEVLALPILVEHALADGLPAIGREVSSLILVMVWGQLRD